MTNSLNISYSEIKSPLSIILSGRLDTMTAPPLEKIITELPEEIMDLIFDMTDLEYMSSSGLRILLTTSKLMSSRAGTFTLMNVGETVREVLEITGFLNFITVKENNIHETE